jgi:Xaa-Pro aminopeptidase
VLDADAIVWLDAYHTRVRETLTRLVDPDTTRWLAEATPTLGRQPGGQDLATKPE